MDENKATQPEREVCSDNCVCDGHNAAAGGVCEAKDNAGKTKKPPRKRLIKTIPRRTLLNYFLFAIAILALLWTVFFVGLLNFSSVIAGNDIKRIGTAISAAFPKRTDDNSMNMFYHGRLSDAARENGVSILVFERLDGGGFKVIKAIDAMGNSSELDATKDIVLKVDFDRALSEDKGVGSVDTEYGSFVYHVSEHLVDDGQDKKLLDMAVLKPYNVFNSQTKKLLLVLGLCSGVVIVMACGCALIASRVQTMYLTDFTKKAKRVAAGDYDVKYSGHGYEEYEILASALNDATESVKSAEKLQRDFIANVSHDIRTPITIIRAYAEMIRDLPQDEEKRKKTADTIISEADKLTTLTNDVMDYSRLSSGVTEFSFEPCDLSAVARSVLERFDLFAERDGMKLLSEIENGITATCDKVHIAQVIYNLINNACNYCGDDNTVILRVKNVNGVARVEVEDHGKGIAPEDTDAVWTRYYRTAHAKRTTVGSGLGLSICNNILKAHDAAFGVNSEVGKGSTFWFELQIANKKK